MLAQQPQRDFTSSLVAVDPVHYDTINGAHSRADALQEAQRQQNKYIRREQSPAAKKYPV